MLIAKLRRENWICKQNKQQILGFSRKVEDRGGSNPILHGHPLEISENFAINKSFFVSCLITVKLVQNVDQL